MRIIIFLCLFTTAAWAQTSPPDTEPRGVGAEHVCDVATYYPVSALVANAEGVTTLAFTISTQGSVTNINIKASSGNADLDNASIECVKTWQYQPATRGGVPVEAPWESTISWSLHAKLIPAYTEIERAAHSCAKIPPPTDDQLNRASSYTSIAVLFSNGAIDKMAVAKSSGNPELDQRAYDCLKASPSTLVDQIAGKQQFDFPFVWGAYKIW